MTDDPTGFERAPDRYTAKGRETIDRIRDELGDRGFVAFCVGNAMKYEDRQGLKDDPAQDAAKAEWYRRMAAHVESGAPDPRASRPGFVPYVRPGGRPWARDHWATGIWAGGYVYVGARCGCLQKVATALPPVLERHLLAR